VSRHIAICLTLLLAGLNAVAQSTQSVGPGNIRLLPGYADTPMRPLDSAEVGRISKLHGLVITYDIGLSAGHYEVDPKVTRSAVWQTEQITGGRKVVCIYTKSKTLLITFPESSANFYAKIHNQRDVAEMMLMILTYKEK
jgi:hypothetical protein